MKVLGLFPLKCRDIDRDNNDGTSQSFFTNIFSKQNLLKMLSSCHCQNVRDLPCSAMQTEHPFMSSHKLTLHLCFLPGQLSVSYSRPWLCVSFCAVLWHYQLISICFPFQENSACCTRHSSHHVPCYSVLLFQVSGVSVQSERALSIQCDESTPMGSIVLVSVFVPLDCKCMGDIPAACLTGPLIALWSLKSQA